MALTTTAFTIGTFAVTYGLIYAAIAAVGVIASTAIGVTSGVQSANAAQAQADYQAQVNAANAKAAREAAQAKVENQRRAAKFTNGTALAKLGGMGALAEGSPLDSFAQDAGQQKYDMMVTEWEGESQAIQFQQAASLNNYQAEVSKASLPLNVASTIADGAAQVGSLLVGAGTSFAKAGTTSTKSTLSTGTTTAKTP